MAPVWHEIYSTIWCCCCLKEPKRIFIFYLSCSSFKKKMQSQEWNLIYIHSIPSSSSAATAHICVAHKNNPFSLNLCKSCCFSRSLLHEKFHELFDFRSFSILQIGANTKNMNKKCSKTHKEIMWRITHENKFQLLCELLSKLFQQQRIKLSDFRISFSI